MDFVLQTAERQGRSDFDLDKLKALAAADGENIRRLANIAVAHESRLGSHESRLNELENDEAK